MVAPAIGQVVLVPFPFSDLAGAKLRPAVVLADAGRDDWVLCQVTSNPYSDPRAIKLGETDFQSGSLQVTSYARPSKLFTANSSLMVSQVGHLKIESARDIVEAVVSLLRMGIQSMTRAEGE
jgi:mRNA interferase MazF